MRVPARRLELIGEAEYRDEAEPLLTDIGQTVMLVRGRPRSLVMRCPDGCGEVLVVNLDERAGKAWRLDMRGEGPTLFPSVWRDGGCDSHFVVWRGRIIWCEKYASDNVEPPYDAAIESRVFEALDTEEYRSAATVAFAIDEIVWDVDRAAHVMAQRGMVESCNIEASWLFRKTCPLTGR